MALNTMESLANDSVFTLYEKIVTDTIGDCQEIFLDEGIDEGILQELERLWRGKLKQSCARSNGETVSEESNESIPSHHIEPPPTVQRNTDVKFINLHRVQPSSNIPIVPPTTLSSMSTNQNVNVPMSSSMSASSQIFVNNQRLRGPFPPQQPRPYPNIYTVQRGVVYNPFRMVPIQVTLSNGEAIFIQVPHMLLTGQRIQYLLSPLITQATIGLNPMQASQVIQQHINNYVQAHTQNAATVASAAAAAASQQTQSKNATIFRQLDGQNDLSRKRKKAHVKEMSSSSDDLSKDSVDSEDSELSEDTQNDEETNSACANDDSVSLNSNDDISDTETDHFQTENLIVCQYYKISRVRNVWRLILKDGIANLNGKDYVFQRMFGDASW